ncbi:transcriptional regulator [Deinococcus rubellus]|uniref:Transcriptional regulator n=1 Tax=Deinococcus rubellus TaxID=1889240 RepID=A0ABY5YEX4_9DEIO|nr:transcriptional regulator [Deinococcus rubellus]UWX63630.1 transcriptional regulator [Deinococcus rubellus]
MRRGAARAVLTLLLLGPLSGPVLAAQVATPSVTTLPPAALKNTVPSTVVASITTPTDAARLLSALIKNTRFVVRGEASVTVLFPPRPTPIRTAQSLPLIEVFPAMLKQNFDIKRQPDEVVAQRPSQVFTLTPKVGAAASWRVWVDARWNVPLAYEERSADGSLARRAELLRADKLQKRGKPVQAAALPGLAQALRQALPGLALPPGFRAVGVGRRPAGAQVVFSDGLNVLALVTAQKGVKAAQGVVSRKVGDGFVWLVGNLTAQDLQTALKGIRPGDLSALGTFMPPDDSNP